VQNLGPLPIFSLIFPKCISQCEGFPAPNAFLILLSGCTRLLSPNPGSRPASTLNSLGVSKSKVAKEAEEKPKDFVKPLVGSDVLLLWIGKRAPPLADGA
jgi:hypothetical protein